MGSEEVLVIGGGPAGSTVASFLAMQGRRVTLLEKERFPREHVGESLLPYCYPIFAELGVLEQLKGRFVRKPGVRFVDAAGSSRTTWCFGHVIKDESYLSFHVIRGEFDQLLLDNARRLGTTVHEGTRVQRVDLDDCHDEIRVRALGPAGERLEFRPRFLVDASGRDACLASSRGWRRPHPSLDRTALSTHWLDGKFVEGIEEGLLQIVYLGGEKQGWIWVIPVGLDRLSVGVVLNHSHIRRRKAELLAQRSPAWKLDLYRSELESAPLVREILSDARIAQPLMVNGNYSYSVEQKHGRNFCLVGDAGAFIDPIFASGVYLAMQSSKLVAEAVDGVLRGEERASLSRAYEQIDGAYRLVGRAIGLFYDPSALNFAQAGSLRADQKHETALAIGHYLLAGDFFARHRKYDEFLDLLEDPRQLARYKKLVIERPEFQSNSCGMDRVEIFHRLLEAESA